MKCTLKIYLFREGFLLSSEGMVRIRDLCIFIVYNQYVYESIFQCSDINLE